YDLTIPVSRVSFIMSKTLLLFMWIMMLTMIAWFLTLFLGLLTQFDGLDISLLVESFKEFSIGGGLLFILSTPIILVTLVMKKYVFSICFFFFCYNFHLCYGGLFGARGVISMGIGRRYCYSYSPLNISARILLYSYNSYSPHRIYCVDRLF